MALLRDLPNEVLVMIARLMVGRRIDHFDPVATRDLQSLRLVSQSVCYVPSFLRRRSPRRRDYGVA